MSDPQPRFSGVVACHVGRYPLMGMEDLYKLAFQAAMGSEHALTDPRAAEDALLTEAGSVCPDSTIDLSEPILPAGSLVRVHLAPFLHRSLCLSALFSAFADTARSIRGNVGLLLRLWSVIEEMAGEGDIPFSKSALGEFMAVAAARDFPSMSHSEAYRRAYRPAYRVVDPSCSRGRLGSLLVGVGSGLSG